MPRLPANPSPAGWDRHLNDPLHRGNPPAARVPADQLASAVARVLDDSQWGYNTGEEWRCTGNASRDRASLGKTLRNQVWDQMKAIMDGATGRDLLASESREYDRLEVQLDALAAVVNEHDIELPGAAAAIAGDYRPEAAYREGQPLAQGQSFQGFAAARGHLARESANSSGYEAELSLGKYIKGAFTGDWRGASDEAQVFNAMSGAGAASGGVLLPTRLSTGIIDLARAQTRVLQAGATIVPMDTRTVDVARWTQDPTPTWRLENAPITESDGALDKITLTAKTLAVVTRVSRELIEDTDVEEALRNAFARAFALKVDMGALYGSGADPEPRGVKNTAGVTKTALATNGASPTWDALVDSVGRLEDANEEATAQIVAGRTLRSLAKAKDSAGQYIGAPSYLDGVERYATSQVPINLTTGTSTDTSDVFTGDWRQLFVSVRIDLTITPLQERFMPDAGQYGFVAWYRGDIQVARPKAFDVVTGVRA